ncbi:MAG: NIPSNAP family protein [Bacteroidetes bacterium]|nr:NIPSNAP family protein [Bacteroidota bacterium]
MVIVRDVFQLKFGMARDAIATMKEIAPVMKAATSTPMSVSVDLTGQAYRMVLETQYPNLAMYESEMAKGMSDPAWKSWYEKFKPLCESSYREMWKSVDL